MPVAPFTCNTTGISRQKILTVDINVVIAGRLHLGELYASFHLCQILRQRYDILS
jgi:hypothetical protein